MFLIPSIPLSLNQLWSYFFVEIIHTVEMQLSLYPRKYSKKCFLVNVPETGKDMGKSKVVLVSVLKEQLEWRKSQSYWSWPVRFLIQISWFSCNLHHTHELSCYIRNCGYFWEMIFINGFDLKLIQCFTPIYLPKRESFVW